MIFPVGRLLLSLALAAAPAAAAAAAATGVIPSTAEGRYTIGPTYTPDPALSPCDDCANGTMFELFLPIADTFYDCDPTNNPTLDGKCADGYCGQQWGPLGTRNITVYVPSTYQDGEEAAVLIATENDAGMMDGLIKPIMDNLINNEDEDRSLPTFVAIAVGLAGPGSQASFDIGPCVSNARSQQLQTISDDFAKFVDENVLDFVTNHPDVKKIFPNFKITDDPAGRAAYGVSAGGQAAFQMAFFKPERFGIAVTYSAALTKAQNWSDAYPLDGAEFWVPSPNGQELIKDQPAKPIRLFFSASEFEMGAPDGCIELPSGDRVDVSDETPTFNGPYLNILEANNKSMAAFEEMGYTMRYAYALDACHVDIGVMKQDFPNTLVWAFADWKEKQSATSTDAPVTGTALDEEPVPAPTLVEEGATASTPSAENAASSVSHYRFVFTTSLVATMALVFTVL